MKKVILIATIMFSAMVLNFASFGPTQAVAQESVSASISAAPEKSGLESAKETLEKVDEKIPVEVSGGVMAIIVFALELLLRAFPTKNPKSLFLGIGAIFRVIGSIFSKISELFDKIGQNLKDKK